MKTSQNQVVIHLNTKLEKRFEEAWNLEPLTTVVEKALAVLAGAGEDDKEPRLNSRRWPNARWLAGMALRAVAEAVIRDGQLPVPFRVDLGSHRYNHRPEDSDAPAAPAAPAAPPIQRADEHCETESLELDVPEIFLKLANEYYHLDPKRLGNAIIYNFCCEPPHDLILVSRNAPSDEPDEESPPELNRLDR